MVGMFLLACGWQPSLELGALEPTEVREGDVVEARGAGFGPGVAVRLRGERAERVLGALVEDAERLRFRVPALPPGPYEVEIRRGPRVVTGALRVLPPPQETPCERPYEANTAVDLVEGIAVVVRFFPDGRHERVRLPIASIERVEYRETPDCAAIVFHTSEGALLFEDGPPPLVERARTLGQMLGRPVTGLPDQPSR